jgi:hypothetical protein
VHAGELGPEVWIGGGVSYPDYHNSAEAYGRGGIGVILANRFTLGISAQADRDHFYYFADGGMLFRQVGGIFTPYGRFQIGRRDDRSDTAMGWAGGLRVEGDGIGFYFEANGIFEPEDDKGLSLGIWF